MCLGPQKLLAQLRAQKLGIFLFIFLTSLSSTLNFPYTSLLLLVALYHMS